VFQAGIQPYRSGGNESWRLERRSTLAAQAVARRMSHERPLRERGVVAHQPSRSRIPRHAAATERSARANVVAQHLNYSTRITTGCCWVLVNSQKGDSGVQWAAGHDHEKSSRSLWLGGISAHLEITGTTNCNAMNTKCGRSSSLGPLSAMPINNLQAALTAFRSWANHGNTRWPRRFTW